MSDHCHVDPVIKEIEAGERAGASAVALAFGGMGCPNCAMRVRNSLLRLDGVLDAEVDHVAGRAAILYHPERTTVPTMIEAVRRAGGDGRHEYWATVELPASAGAKRASPRPAGS